MATFTWNTGSTGTWSTSTNWVGNSAPPPTDTSDTALFLGAASPYTVNINSGVTESIGTLQFQVATTLGASPTIDVTGTLTAGSVRYLGVSGGAIPAAITIESGGLFDVTGVGASAFVVTSGISESISIDSGGTLELGANINNSVNTNKYLTFSFNNNLSGRSAGVVEYDTLSYQSGGAYVLNKGFANVAWGDGVIFKGYDFSSDTVSYSGTTLDISNGSSTVLQFTNFQSSLSSGDFKIVYNAAGNYSELSAVCFARGTLIRTPEGEIAVERLRTGDTVLVQQNGSLMPQPVVWRGHRRIDLIAHPKPAHVAPIRIRAGAFGEGLPVRDLILSPDHALLIDGKLIAARQLVNGASITQEEGWTAVDYYHVELDRHAILLAEGLPAESYLDTGNRGFFANSGAPLILHPDLTEDRSALSREAGACAPFVTDEATVRPVWQRMADRAAALGLQAPATARTSDPALRLIAKGRSIAPVFAEAGLYIFSLPLGATGARIASRAAEPAALRPWLDDRRALGVAVKRIVLRTAEDVMEVPVDSPDLHDGWWDVERAGATAFRWTAGSALLPFPAFSGHAMLELHLHGTAEYPVEAEAARRAEVA